MRREEGFTLIELMVVLAIIIMLAVLAIGQYTKYRKESMRTTLASFAGLCLKDLVTKCSSPDFETKNCPEQSDPMDHIGSWYNVYTEYQENNWKSFCEGDGTLTITVHANYGSSSGTKYKLVCTAEMENDKLNELSCGSLEKE